MWSACGTEGRLIDANRKLIDWLESKDIRHTWLETGGAHTWMVWRRHLAQFEPMLFQRPAARMVAAISRVVSSSPLSARRGSRKAS